MPIIQEKYGAPRKYICDLCDRKVEALTRHHLIPKSRGGSKGDIILVCHSCKDMIHKLIPNKELEREYNTVSKIKEHSKVKTYLKWIKKQKKDRVTMAKKKRKL